MHKSGAQNKVADALSRQAEILAVLTVEVIGFDQLKEMYAGDVDFKGSWQKCNTRESCGDFHIH